MLLFVIYERSLKLDCNQNLIKYKFYRNTSVKKRYQIILQTPSEDVVAGEMLSVGKL